MKQPRNTFLMQFQAAHRAHHLYFIARKTRQALDIGAALQRLGLVRSICEAPAHYLGNPRNLVRASRRHFGDYMIVWLDSGDRPLGGQDVALNQRHRNVHRSFTFHRLELRLKPSHRIRDRLSHAQLRDSIRGHWNILHLMETSRGVVTSEEALRLRLGGYVICTFHL